MEEAMQIDGSVRIEIDGDDGLFAALSALLSQEAEAVSQYKAMIASLPEGSGEVRSELDEIIGDEENHIGRLAALLATLDQKAGERIAAGMEGKE